MMNDKSYSKYNLEVKQESESNLPILGEMKLELESPETLNYEKDNELNEEDIEFVEKILTASVSDKKLENSDIKLKSRYRYSKDWEDPSKKHYKPWVTSSLKGETFVIAIGAKNL